jgi:hypothetical protein
LAQICPTRGTRVKTAKKRLRDIGDVLRYSPKPADKSTVRRYYAILRGRLGLPDRCDNEACKFFNEPLIWNGERLKPILDHRNGNCKDSSETNLRYLCPNCDSQLTTRGGGNRGRVLEATEENKYVLKKDDGFRDTHLIMPTARLSTGTLDRTVVRKETSAA